MSAAGYIEEIRLDGTAKVWRDKAGKPGVLEKATRAASELSGVLPRPARSFWEWVYLEAHDDEEQ